PGRCRLLLGRVLWVVVRVGAWPAGGWVPRLGSRTFATHTRGSDAGAPVETTTRSLRTPFVVQESIHAVDAEGRVSRSERHLTFQLPVLLLVFFGLVRWIEVSAARPGRHSGAEPTIGAEPAIRAEVDRRTRGDPGSGAAPGSAPSGMDGRGSGGVAAVVLAAGLAAAACGGEDVVPDPEERPARVFVDVAWDTVARLAVAPDDTLLFTADAVAADSSGIWVLDRIGRQVVRFGWDAELRAYAGRPGAGPGELMAPQVIDASDDGRLWVLDSGAGRVSAFEPDGTLASIVPLSMLESMPHSFGVSRDGSTFLMVFLSDALEPVILHHEERRVERGPPILLPDAAGVGGLRLQGTIARARGADDWVYALTLGDGMFRMRGHELIGERIWFPEPVPFSRLVESVSISGNTSTLTRQLTEPTFAAREVSVTGGWILVRFHGRTEDAGRILDRYDLSTGAYIDSALLPRSASIGAWEDRLALVSNDPSPEVLVLRRREGGWGAGARHGYPP